MKIEEFLAPEDVIVGVSAADKERLLTDLSARAAARLAREPSEIAQEVLRREALGSTGMGGGIAIPHARLAHLDKPFGLLARLKRPLDFDAVDSGAVDLVFLLLQPAAAQSDLNALAAVARALRDAERLEKLRAAATSADLYRAIAQP
jgi:PTS system nitrogen regulatory IIA component